MALIGSLAVNILAKTNKFDKPLKKSRQGLTDFQKSAKGVTSQLKMLGGAALAAVGVAGLGSFVNGQLSAIDNLAKTADKLGLTTERLGGYRYAAELAGVSNEMLDKGIETLSKNISEAARGFGRGQRGLEALNLDAEKLIKLDLDKRIELVGQRISELANDADKVAITKQLFGDPALINAFAGGLGQVADEYERLGLAVNREDARKIEQFNDALTKLSKQVGALGRGVVITASDTAIEAVRGLTVLAENTGLLETKTAKQEAAREADRLRRARGEDTPKLGRQSYYEASVSLLGKFIALATGSGGERMFAGRSPEIEQRQRDLGVWLPRSTQALERIEANTRAGVGGGGITLNESDM